MKNLSLKLVTAAVIFLPFMAIGDPQILKSQGLGVASTSTKSDTQAKLMSLRAARIDAQRKLLAEIEGVQVTGGSTVKDLMLTSDVIGTRIKGMLKGAFEISSAATKEGDDWVSAVEMAVCLTSDSAECRGQINLATLAKPYLKITPEKDLYSNQDLTESASKENIANNAVPLPLYTGLVLDTTKIKVTPRLDIRIKTSKGKELYGPGYVTEGKDWLHWVTSVEEARALASIAGANPMIISELEINGAEEIILDDLIAAALFSENLRAGDFLAEGKVIFVVSNQEL